MTDPIATIRKALRFVHVEPDHDNALNALDALEAERTALRESARAERRIQAMITERLIAFHSAMIDRGEIYPQPGQPLREVGVVLPFRADIEHGETK